MTETLSECRTLSGSHLSTAPMEMDWTYHVMGIGQHHPYGLPLNTRGEMQARMVRDNVTYDCGGSGEDLS